jgi:hypothetical protein
VRSLGVVTEATRPLVHIVLPDLAAELGAALVDLGRSDLAEQIATLRIWDRCRCGDSFCTSFYVGPKPKDGWRREGIHENVVPDVDPGMIVLDVVDGIVRYIEVLDRPEIRAALRASTRVPPP